MAGSTTDSDLLQIARDLARLVEVTSRAVVSPRAVTRAIFLHSDADDQQQCIAPPPQIRATS
jgi:hypothetical protein